MTVISDTSPLNYLVLIDLQDVLPALFGQVLIPEAVRLLDYKQSPGSLLLTMRRPPELSRRRSSTQPVLMGSFEGQRSFWA
jgi:hypothetical protein